MDDMRERLRHYHIKCSQHLNRVRLSHLLALKALENEKPLVDTDYQDLVLASFADMPWPKTLAKMHSALHKQHLVSLKINFELFLDRLLTTVWSFNFAELAAKVSRKEEEVPLHELAESIVRAGESNVDMRDFVIGRIVPEHGLHKFEEKLKDATKVRLRDILYAKNRHYWPQILTAFEIRHLVEHRDGWVNAKFRENVKDVWSNSSWGERLSLDGLHKVPVEEVDVIKTHDAMLNSVDIITEKLLQWRPGPTPSQ